jgi:hypothetical protein
VLRPAFKSAAIRVKISFNVLKINQLTYSLHWNTGRLACDSRNPCLLTCAGWLPEVPEAIRVAAAVMNEVFKEVFDNINTFG